MRQKNYKSTSKYNGQTCPKTAGIIIKLLKYFQIYEVMTLKDSKQK